MYRLQAGEAEQEARKKHAGLLADDALHAGAGTGTVHRDALYAGGLARENTGVGQE